MICCDIINIYIEIRNVYAACYSVYNVVYYVVYYYHISIFSKNMYVTEPTLIP